MFEQNFNPEFHWQIDQKRTIHKKTLFVFVVLILLLSIFFIFQRYYFVSGRNISLEQLIPNNIKALLTINIDDIVKNEQGLLIFEMGLKDFLRDDKRVNSIIENIDKDIYWIEKDFNSQVLLFKAFDINLVKNNFNIVTDNSENIEFNNKIIFESNIENINNPLLPILENKIYITYLNDYIFCISNDLDSVKSIINKYKEASKVDYFGAIKDEFSGYFQEQTTLMLRVLDYDAIGNSLSWIRNLSFITQDNEKKSFVIKFKINSKKVELLFSDSQDNKQMFDVSRMSENLLDDYLIYYKNSGINYEGDVLNLSNNVDNFLKNNMEGLYNINFREELLNVDFSYYFLMYSDNKFLIISEDSERVKSIYRNILAHLKPQTRTMILPDGTSAIEYYVNPSVIELKEQENQNIIWYYVDLPGNIDFYLAQYDNYYILSNFRDEVVKLLENQEEFCKILDCGKKNSSIELLTLNLKDFDQKKYLPWLDFFSEDYNRLKFINLNENGDNKLFFELIH